MDIDLDHQTLSLWQESIWIIAWLGLGVWASSEKSAQAKEISLKTGSFEPVRYVPGPKQLAASV